MKSRDKNPEKNPKRWGEGREGGEGRERRRGDKNKTKIISWQKPKNLKVVWGPKSWKEKTNTP